MIVAVSVTSVLLLLVSRVFNETTKAINIGADTSQIVSNARILSDQAFQDAARMSVAKANPEKSSSRDEFADEAGGFLVIIQQRNAGVRFPDPTNTRQDPEEWLAGVDRNGDGDANDPGEPIVIRTDQIAFFAQADHTESITPAAPDRYDSEAFAPFQRIWLGHVARANLDGSMPTNTEPGQAPAAGDDFDMSQVTNLVIGRQGLFILDDQSLYPDGERVYDGTTYNAPDTSLLFAGSGTNGFQVGVNFGVTNTIRIDETDVANANGVDSDTDAYDQLWKGATDVIALRDPDNEGQSFASFFESFATGSTVNIDGLYDIGSPTNGLTDPGRAGFTRTLDDQELPNEAYARHALSWAFATPGQRPLTTQDIDYPYAPEAVGRNHTFFIPYVSDFAVDFAADITDDYTLADDPNTLDDPSTTAVENVERILLPWWDPRFQPDWPTGQWRSIRRNANGDEIFVDGFFPDGLPDGRPDEYVYFQPSSNGDVIARIVGIKWYNMAYDPTVTPNAAIGANPVWVQNSAGVLRQGLPFDRTEPVTWRLPRNANAANPSTLGPFANPLQLDGEYHTLPSSNLASSRIEYPPLVGHVGLPTTAFPEPIPNVLAFEDNPAFPPNVQNRAVFVFGHTPDYDLDQSNIPLAAREAFGFGTDDDGFEAGSAKWWPYALRIRFRLHDGDGTYASVGEVPSATPALNDPSQDEFDPIPGKWFEQIVPIRHHDNHRPDLPN
ncbi:MAG: hypothetical protein AAGE65_01775 [Planctomycetota bacterium]